MFSRNKILLKINESFKAGFLMLILCFLFSPILVHALPAFLTPTCSSSNCEFVFLAPIDFPGFNIKDGKVNVAGEAGASAYLKGLYTFGIAVASALAVMVIIAGGVQYASTDAINGKSEGKDKIKAALTGLVLALVSYTILNTLNPNLVSNSFQAQPIAVNAGIEQGGGGLIPVDNSDGGPGIGTNPYDPDVAVANGEEAARIDAAAQAMMGKTTCSISGTDGGNKACAYVINDIIDEALGAPIDGRSGDESSYGLATTEMYNSLKTSDRFHYAGNDLSTIQAGDIIISPTSGKNSGHVGIYSSTGRIISNSSSQKQVDDNHTLSTWKNYYSDKKGLPTYIFRPTQLNTD